MRRHFNLKTSNTNPSSFLKTRPSKRFISRVQTFKRKWVYLLTDIAFSMIFLVFYYQIYYLFSSRKNHNINRSIISVISSSLVLLCISIIIIHILFKTYRIGWYFIMWCQLLLNARNVQKLMFPFLLFNSKNFCQGMIDR